MSDFGAGGGQYVTYREHISAKEEAAKKMAALELEQGTQRAALMHLPEDVRQLTQAVNALGNKMAAPAPGNDALAQAITAQSLAMQRQLDAIAKAPPPPQQGWKNPDMLPWLLFFGLLGAIVGDASGLLSLIG